MSLERLMKVVGCFFDSFVRVVDYFFNSYHDSLIDEEKHFITAKSRIDFLIFHAVL